MGRQILARVGQPTAGELESGIGAQMIEIIGILIATGDGENAGADHVSERVRDPPTRRRLRPRRKVGRGKRQLP